MELILQGITKSFGDKKVLQGAGFHFQKGKIYGLLGRNGVGKTTLFNCLSGETKIDSGHAWLKDEEDERKLVEEDIGYVYSLPILPEFLTGYEFIKFYLDINRDKRPSSNIDAYFDKMSMSQEDITVISA